MAIFLCFKYITLDSKKSHSMQKDALLETDGKVNNQGRMNTFLRNSKPRSSGHRVQYKTITMKQISLNSFTLNGSSSDTN